MSTASGSRLMISIHSWYETQYTTGIGVERKAGAASAGVGVHHNANQRLSASAVRRAADCPLALNSVE